MSQHALLFKRQHVSDQYVPFEIQWGSEIRPFEIRELLKSRLLGSISNGWALPKAIAMVPTI